jgi:hypothetical protein
MKMKKLIATLMILISTGAIAQESTPNENTSNDFGRVRGDLKQLSATDISYRFYLKGEMFIVSADGEQLITVSDETREWEFNGQVDKPLISNWRVTHEGLPTVALHHEWTLQKDGKIAVVLQQYEDIERNGRDVKMGKLLKEEKFILKDFAPVNYTVAAGNKKIVIRLSPGVWPDLEVVDVPHLPVSLKNAVMYDRGGRVYADDLNVSGAFMGIVTHQGALYLSFTPFPGAKVIGTAKGPRIKVKAERTIIIQSERDIVPNTSKVNVYGFFRPGTRTERLQSVRTMTGNQQNEFVSRINEQ